MAEYFAEKLGLAVVGVSWRSTNSKGTPISCSRMCGTMLAVLGKWCSCIMDRP